MRSLSGLALVLVLAQAGAVSTQVGAPPAAPGAGTGLILGQVVDAGDGRPVGGATVSMSGGGFGSAAGNADRAAPNSVVADSQGRFLFSGLPPGSFVLTASAPGYLSGASGQERPNGGLRPIVLGPGQKVGSVVVALWKAAAISGTAVDEFGEPVVGAVVRVLARQVSGSTPRLTPGQTTRTDDRGSYRLWGLTPGEYLVMMPSSTTTMPVAVAEQVEAIASHASTSDASRALLDILNASGTPTSTSSGIRVADAYLQAGAQFGPASTLAYARDDGRVFVQPVVFFSGAANASGAAVVTLGSGEERSNVDFQVSSVTAFEVSGTLTGPDGPAAHLGVRLLPAELDAFTSDAGLEVASTVSSADGRFTLMAVPPGAYQLRVLRVPRPPGPAPIVNGVPQVRVPVEPTLFADLPVTVGGGDVAGLSVSLRAGPRLSGRVEFDGAAPRPPFAATQQIPVVLTHADGRSNPGLLPAFVNADGQFTTMSVPPGRYLVSATAPGWTLRSAEIGGRDAADVAVDLDDDVSGAVLRFFDRPGLISGVVHNDRGEPDPGGTVFLFPADHQAWIENGASPRRFRTARTSADGRYTLSGVIPGEYLLIAMSGGTIDTSNRRALTQAAAPLAEHVSIAEAARLTQNLTSRVVR